MCLLSLEKQALSYNHYFNKSSIITTYTVPTFIVCCTSDKIVYMEERSALGIMLFKENTVWWICYYHYKVCIENFREEVEVLSKLCEPSRVLSL